MKITNEQLYQSIFKRKSTRVFNHGELTQQQVMTLTQALKGLEEFSHFSLPYNIDYVLGDKLKFTFNVKAPAALVFTTTQHPLTYVYTGMMMQQADLICSTLNIGSCWLGVASAEHDQADLKSMGILAVGNSDKNIHRTESSQFKRLPLSAIRDNGYFDSVIEAARLAPSSMNQQFWTLEVKPDEIIVRLRKGFSLGSWMLNRLHQIDSGIAIAHLAISLKHHGYKFTCVLNESLLPRKDWIAQFIIEA